MKKILTLALAVLMALSLFACSAKDENTAPAATKQPPKAPAPGKQPSKSTAKPEPSASAHAPTAAKPGTTASGAAPSFAKPEPTAPAPSRPTPPKPAMPTYRPSFVPPKPAAAPRPAEAPKPDLSRVVPGAIVIHRAFGAGSVLSIEKKPNGSAHVQVKFGETIKTFGYPGAFYDGFLKVKER